MLKNILLLYSKKYSIFIDTNDVGASGRASLKVPCRPGRGFFFDFDLLNVSVKNAFLLHFFPACEGEHFAFITGNIGFLSLQGKLNPIFLQRRQ